MQRIILTIFLIVTVNSLFAQYIHYTDKRHISSSNTPATTTPTVMQETPKKIPRDTVKMIVRDTVKMEVRDTVKILVRDTVKSVVHDVVHDTLRIMVRDTIEIVIHDTVNICPTVVYHKWPDRCPGLSGAIPVINNYVPEEMVLKLTEIYKGHLYSISSSKNANNKVQYKLKVCEEGVVKFKYADENGTILSK
ncbi:MAG: hypothetical protein ABI472_13645 [Ginsengibacter sp.]